MAIYGLHAVKIGGGELAQITDMSVGPGLTHLIHASGGQVDPTFVATSKAAPAITFTTTQVDVAFQLLDSPMAGKKITNAGDPVILYFQGHTEFATRETTNFMSVTITDCLVVPQTLTAQDGQAATLTFAVIPALAAGTNVVTVVTNAADPNITMGATELYTCGPAKINTALLETDKWLNLQSMTLNFGITLNIVGGDGNVYSQFVGIQSRRPTMQLQFTDRTAFSELLTSEEMTGKAQTGSDSTVFLRAMIKNAARYAAGTGEHISIAMDDGVIFPTQFAASGQTPGNAGVTLQPNWDGSHAQFVISTGSAAIE